MGGQKIAKSAHHELWSALEKRQQQSFCIIHSEPAYFFKVSRATYNTLTQNSNFEVWTVNFDENILGFETSIETLAACLHF